jgi:hypothetical protein
MFQEKKKLQEMHNPQHTAQYIKTQLWNKGKKNNPTLNDLMHNPQHTAQYIKTQL